ncbi:MAG TPA: GGDEF domain-containing protein [bacterium]|nr:GGDEF domain-containing protein [bacterium]
MPTKKKEAPESAKISRISPNAALNERMATLNQGLLSLYHASAELQFSKPLTSLLKSILRGLKTGTGISKAVIFIKEESSSSLAGCVAIGLNEKKIMDMNVLLTADEETDLLKTCQTSTSTAEPTPAKDRLTMLFEGELEFKDAEMVALEIRDHLIGLLVYEKVPAFLHQEILIIFSRQAALTIENARLFSKVEEMAIRDTLTGLYNRRYFQQILDYELNRAKRYHQSLSLIFIDLDHFKEINDQFGHSVGDQFLKQISQKLSSLFRTTDLVARYAGDEFVAILPATAGDGAMILAKRIQEALGNYQIMVRGRTLQVSVSIGVDTYESAEGIGGVTLIDRADKAMYEAKAHGRNCVRSYQEIQKALV